MKFGNCQLSIVNYQLLIFIYITSFIPSVVSAQQGTYTITVDEGGVANELGGVASSVRNLTVKGSINANDVMFMRDKFSLLNRLDMHGITITNNIMSDNSFYNGATVTTMLTSVKLPLGITSIGAPTILIEKSYFIIHTN
jgi:hypothetical protein